MRLPRFVGTIGHPFGAVGYLPPTSSHGAYTTLPVCLTRGNKVVAAIAPAYALIRKRRPFETGRTDISAGNVRQVRVSFAIFRKAAAAPRRPFLRIPLVIVS